MTDLSSEQVRAATVERMADVYARWRQNIPPGPLTSYNEGPYEVSMENARIFMALALAAALDDRCQECAGRGGYSMPEWQGEPEPCHTCDGSGVLSVSLKYVEQIGTADFKDQLVSLDAGWAKIPTGMKLPHPIWSEPRDLEGREE